MLDLYILQGHEPVRVDDMDVWARSLAAMDRRVAYDEVGPLRVSTVFLGIDHRWGDEGPPLVFETMIFGEDALHPWASTYCMRGSTWTEALMMHARALASARKLIN